MSQKGNIIFKYFCSRLLDTVVGRSRPDEMEISIKKSTLLDIQEAHIPDEPHQGGQGKDYHLQSSDVSPREYSIHSRTNLKD